MVVPVVDPDPAVEPRDDTVAADQSSDHGLGYWIPRSSRGMTDSIGAWTDSRGAMTPSAVRTESANSTRFVELRQKPQIVLK